MVSGAVRVRSQARRLTKSLSMSNFVFINGEKKELDSYLAVAIAEGFCEGEDASVSAQLEAWAYLIRHGLCWSLQGFFGRMASNLIEKGIISGEGVINWEAVS
jgi:hypothetical protein